ncbi:MAG: alpha/beta fold hydrolase [Catenulispora sp.]
MARLVFVHGIGANRQRSEQQLADWTAALAEGARAAGHGAAARDLTFGGRLSPVLARYAEQFADGQPQDVAAARAEGEQDLDTEILHDLLAAEVEDRLADDDLVGEHVTLCHARDQLQPPGTSQGAGDIARRITNVAATLVGLLPFQLGYRATAKVLASDLRQVPAYLSRRRPDASGVTLDTRIRAIVSEALGDGPSVVVAHSLGSVVAWETLATHPGRVPLFVTVGSPLAMRTVVWPRLIPRPPATPETVERWLNFWDRDDVFTGRATLERDWNPNSAGILPVSRRIDSDGLWVHPATQYLADPAVAGPIVEALAMLAEQA